MTSILLSLYLAVIILIAIIHFLPLPQIVKQVGYTFFIMSYLIIFCYLIEKVIASQEQFPTLETLFGVEWGTYLSGILPSFMLIEFLPNTTEHLSGIYTILLAKHNSLICVSHLIVSWLAVCVLIEWGFQLLLDNQVYLTTNYPQIIGWLTQNISYLENILFFLDPKGDRLSLKGDHS